MFLEHEKLHVYQLTLAYIQTVFPVANESHGRAHEICQKLRENSLLIPLFISHANISLRWKLKQNYYHKARLAVHECAALVDVLLAIGVVTQSQWQENKKLLGRLAVLLARMELGTRE